jgi:hypothetical protein
VKLFICHRCSNNGWKCTSDSMPSPSNKNSGMQRNYRQISGPSNNGERICFTKHNKPSRPAAPRNYSKISDSSKHGERICFTKQIKNLHGLLHRGTTGRFQISQKMVSASASPNKTNLQGLLHRGSTGRFQIPLQCLISLMFLENHVEKYTKVVKAKFIYHMCVGCVALRSAPLSGALGSLDLQAASTGSVTWHRQCSSSYDLQAASTYKQPRPAVVPVQVPTRWSIGRCAGSVSISPYAVQSRDPD